MVFFNFFNFFAISVELEPQSKPTIVSPANKKAKKFKKLKNTTMALFRAKIGWKMPGKTEYKKYRSVLFLPDEK